MSLNLKTPLGRKIKHEYEDTVANMVSEMCVVGVPQERIAKALNMHESTLRELYQKELDTALLHKNVKVMNNLYQKCMDGDTTALIFWAKSRMGWRDRGETEVNLTITPPFAPREVKEVVDEPVAIEHDPVSNGLGDGPTEGDLPGPDAVSDSDSGETVR
jgi:Zn-dependent M16 (insulinase) family peptidase